MIIVEYRVPMPFSASEYRIGQLYTIAKKSRLESANSNDGVKIHVNEPYSCGPGGHGQYTNKTYYLASRLPDFIKRLLPGSASAMKLKEEAWNAYPYSKNKFTNPLLDKLTLEIESQYIDGPPTLANVFNLEPKEEAHRSIVMIDFANDRYKAGKSAENSVYGESDIFAFEPLFRQAIDKDWLQDHESSYGNEEEESWNEDDCKFRKQLMTCYKLCRVNFPVWPLQSRVENFIQQYCRDTIIEAHRQAWLWQDEWTGMSLDQIRLMEKDTQEHLAELLRQASLD